MLSKRVRKLRESSGMTQAALAQKLGITRAGVNAWEMGVSVPSTQYIVALAKEFDVSSDFLLGLNESSTLSLTGLDDKDILVVTNLVNHLKKKNAK